MTTNFDYAAKLHHAASKSLAAIDQYSIDTPREEWRDDLAAAYDWLVTALEDNHPSAVHANAIFKDA